MLTYCRASVCVAQRVGITKLQNHTYAWPPDPSVTIAARELLNAECPDEVLISWNLWFNMWCLKRLTSFICAFICRPMYLIQNQLCNCEIENSFVSVFLFSLSKQLCLLKEAAFIWKQSSVTLQLADISLALQLCFSWHFLKYLLHTDLTRFELIDVVMCFKRPAPLTVIFAVQAVPFSLVSCLLCRTVTAAIH